MEKYEDDGFQSSDVSLGNGGFCFALCGMFYRNARDTALENHLQIALSDRPIYFVSQNGLVVANLRGIAFLVIRDCLSQHQRKS